MIEKPQYPWPFRPMDSAPKDRKIIVFAPGAHMPPHLGSGALPDLVCFCEWHSDGGFCVDEFRDPTMWMPWEAAEADTGPIAPERVPGALRELAGMTRRRAQLKDRIPEKYLTVSRLYSLKLSVADVLEAEASRIEAELKGGGR